MRIDAGNDYLAAIQRPQSSAMASNSPVSFSAIMTTATGNAAQAGADSLAQPDFTNMTRKELFGWMNGKIRSGEMSLDDSSALLGMTVKIQPGAAQGAPIALDDRERVNFVQIAQDGIAGARSRNDDMTRKVLETAMQIMRRGHDSRIDQRA